MAQFQWSQLRTATKSSSTFQLSTKAQKFQQFAADLLSSSGPRRVPQMPKQPKTQLSTWTLCLLPRYTRQLLIRMKLLQLQWKPWTDPTHTWNFQKPICFSNQYFHTLLNVAYMGFWGFGVLGFWGLVCIEKWFYNFDSGTRSAIFDPPKMAKIPRFCHFEGTENGTSGARIKILRPLFNTN